MSETRRIIGVFDGLPSTKKDVAFPTVHVWIDGPIGHEARGLKHFFPDRGTVFLHISACDGQHPIRNQVGLFICEPSPPGEKAAWQVSYTSRHLANVIICPTWERNPHHLAFLEWLTAHKNGAACNILLGDGTIFVKRGKSELVGPFQLTPEGGIVARKQIHVFGSFDTIKLEIGGRPFEFIDRESLTRGRPLIVDPRDALHRRLRLAQDASHLDWLSRAKLQELSNALAGVTVSDGSEWVTENLPQALESISGSVNLNDKLSEAILQIKAVSDAIEAVWKKKHAENVKKAQGEIEELKNVAAGIRRTIEDLTQDVARLQGQKNLLEAELQDLNRKIEAVKAEARKVFDAELKRLAASPESLALFAAWSSCSKGVTETKSEPRIRIRRWDTERQKAANFFEALINNLKVSGLSAPSATEVATVCDAALLTGQPISFRSIFSELIADAVVSAMGQPMALWADVPAGILDSLEWDSFRAEDQIASPIVLQGVNRSDISLVLGSMRPAILRQALGQQRPDGLLCMTLESSKDMQVQPDFEIGPVVDDRVLKYGTAKAGAAIWAFAGYRSNLAEVPLITDEEFLEVLGDEIAGLSLFRTSAQKMVYRRAVAGLKMLKKNSEDISRLFFKYWVLPRLTPSDIIRVLNANKEKWKHDAILSELADALTSNE